MTPDDIIRIIGRVSEDRTARATERLCVYAKGFLSWVHDGELPRELARTLKRIPRIESPERIPITEAERDRLLEAADFGAMRAPAARRKALIWLSWDSGFRIGEATACALATSGWKAGVGRTCGCVLGRRG